MDARIVRMMQVTLDESDNDMLSTILGEIADVRGKAISAADARKVGFARRYLEVTQEAAALDSEQRAG